jgi:hypothetical protein
MSRQMIVGREHLTGAARDYDELMEMGAEPEPAPPHPDAPHLRHHPHAPQQHHPHAQHMVPAPPHVMHGHPAPPQVVYVHAPHPHPHAPNGHHEEHHEHQGQGRHRGGRQVGGTRIHSEEPQHERQFPIGFELTNIAAGDEEDIEVKPQVLFRGERLAIAQSIARYFDVLDIKVGKDSQLAATGPLTGEAFETRAVGVRMELDTAQPGIVITLRVKNTDTAAHDFKAVLYGRVLE